MDAKRSFRVRRWLGTVLVGSAVLAGLQALGAADGTGGFLRGDPNRDGKVDLGDVVSTISFLYLGGSCDCLDAADFDASGALDITDAIGLLDYLFLGGPGPKPPFPACGAEGGGGTVLGCESPTCSLEEPVWLFSRISGCRQCQPCFHEPLEDVVAGLTAAGIEVLESRLGGSGLITCLACDVCPADKAFWVLVAGDDVDVLLGAGWSKSGSP